MDPLKQQLLQRLIANVLIDKCSHHDGLVFSDAWCTQDRVIRFTTPFFRTLLPVGRESSGRWRTGDSVMYEVNNFLDSFRIDCVLDLAGSDYALQVEKTKLMNAVGGKGHSQLSNGVLRSWDIVARDGSSDDLFVAFDHFLAETLPLFEQNVQVALSEETTGPVLKEGAQNAYILTKYERNPKAREECLAFHGTACVVCGMDFGKMYGPEFAGKIEVHHIVPLSQIGEEYVVDPIRDLVPVCPNCHAALHSKKDGVYTVEELRALRKRSNASRL